MLILVISYLNTIVSFGVLECECSKGLRNPQSFFLRMRKLRQGEAEFCKVVQRYNEVITKT